MPISIGREPATPAGPLYTRDRALADGFIIDISDHAREAYFRCPMAVSDNLFYRYLSPHYDLLAQGESLSGRIKSVLARLITAIRANPKARRLTFTTTFVMLPDSNPIPAPIPVKITASLGSGDDGKPVITLSLPEENTTRFIIEPSLDYI
jgi:hypothetical protein